MLTRWLTTLALVSFGSFAGPMVQIDTTIGSFTVELNKQQAPVSVDNFLKYVEDGSYVGSVFHRVIPGFMAQGGGFNQQLARLPTYAPIRNEADNGLTNDTATIAMARTSNPNSATRQFYINLVDNDFLNYGERPPGYAVFGKVTQGFDVVKLMATKATTSQGYMRDVPVEPIIITRVAMVEDTKAKARDAAMEEAIQQAASAPSVVKTTTDTMNKTAVEAPAKKGNGDKTTASEASNTTSSDPSSATQ
jgi:peptidyl-prolyl cis-trans isomerase A (cyclophilin A)